MESTDTLLVLEDSDEHDEDNPCETDNVSKNVCDNGDVGDCVELILLKLDEFELTDSNAVDCFDCSMLDILL